MRKYLEISTASILLVSCLLTAWEELGTLAGGLFFLRRFCCLGGFLWM